MQLSRYMGFRPALSGSANPENDTDQKRWRHGWNFMSSVSKTESKFSIDLGMSFRVSTFGHRGLDVCLRLPRAFRSLPRPSSVLGALASTLCSCSLDYSNPETNIILVK